jgi:SpoIIAA-like
MPVQMMHGVGGHVAVKVSGRLTPGDLAEAHADVGNQIKIHGRVRILVVFVDFEGWERSPDWGNDPSVQLAYDRSILRMALVGDRRWEELALIFTSRQTRPFPIAYFGPADLARARAWLEEPA